MALGVSLVLPNPRLAHQAHPLYNPRVMATEDLNQWFIEILKHNESRIFNLVYWQIGDYEEAKDLTQEIFLKVYKNLKKFRKESRVETWVYRIALNHVHSYLRKARHRKGMISWETLDGERTDVGTVDPPEARPEYLQLRQKIRELPDPFREVLLLFYFDEKSLQEISELLGIPVGTVKSRLNRARAMLKKALEDTP